MTARWLTRLVFAALAAAVAWAFTAWVGLRPQPVLLVLTVLACFVLSWLMAEVGMRRQQIDLNAPRRRYTPRWGLDARFSRLSASLREPHDRELISHQVHAILLAIVDERLLAHHGVDRATDPERAREVMGETLARYVEQPPAARRNLMNHLSDMVTRIEAI
jgi:hypothetical protein